MSIANSLYSGSPERAKPVSVQCEEHAPKPLPALLSLVRAGSAAEPVYEPAATAASPVAKLASRRPSTARRQRQRRKGL